MRIIILILILMTTLNLFSTERPVRVRKSGVPYYMPKDVFNGVMDALESEEDKMILENMYNQKHYRRRVSSRFKIQSSYILLSEHNQIKEALRKGNYRFFNEQYKLNAKYNGLFAGAILFNMLGIAGLSSGIALSVTGRIYIAENEAAYGAHKEKILSDYDNRHDNSFEYPHHYSSSEDMVYWGIGLSITGGVFSLAGIGFGLLTGSAHKKYKEHSQTLPKLLISTNNDKVTLAAKIKL